MGSHTAKFLSEAECKIVAISDATGGYFRADGIDIPKALRHAIEHERQLRGFAEADRITNEQVLELDVDVLIPAAIGGVITGANAMRVKAPIIVEAANSPVDPSADDFLEKHGTVILPDILANAGGVTVSYFEWVQNRQYYQWSLDRVRQELDKTLSTAFEQTWDLARERKVSLRTAAFMVGIDRVARAATLGGIS